MGATPDTTRRVLLTEHLPEPSATTGTEPDPDALFDAFTAWATDRGFDLYPHQQDALIELVSGSHVILNTPTGSGKSLVAVGAHFAALASGRRTYYTAPLKALVSEKFFALIDAFGAANVGMLTGDSSVNPTAPIVCCTAEVLANMALRDGADADVGQVVMDEFHFYADPQRGWAWQVPLLELPRAQFLLMSATLGDVSFFEKDLERRTGRPVAVVASVERPVPLSYAWSIEPMHDLLDELLTTHRAPVYVVHFTQAAAIERAQALMSVNVTTRDERDRIAEEVGGFRFSPGFGRTLSRLVRHGIGVHHAGMLPKYRRLVERLTQAGLLKVVCGTDTLGVGINLPIRTVVFSGLTKYDGERTRQLSAREFHQIAGRAGRAGFDTLGEVIVQAPEHVIENERAIAKAGDDAKKRRKVVRRKAPEGFVSWGEASFQRLVEAEPEPLTSSFRVSHAMVLGVIGRPGHGAVTSGVSRSGRPRVGTASPASTEAARGGKRSEERDHENAFEAMRRLLTDNHEPLSRRRQHIGRAIAIYRALLAGGVVERVDPPDETGRIVRLTVDLPPDFALNQPLSPFALAAFDVLDPDAPTFPLDVVSVVEATLDDPRQVLSAQRFKARGEAVAAMKADGIEYDERMELLDDVTWPKPLEDLLDAAFTMYRGSHPWVADYELSPKTVARDLFERAMSFGEYVAYYQLARSEGLLLRYLADAYRTLRQIVPEELRTEAVVDVIEWLGELVRQVDSSLLDEWEQLQNPVDDDGVVRVIPTRSETPRPVTGNRRAFTVAVRNAMFRRVELIARRRWWELGELDTDTGYDAQAWADAMAPYFDEYDDVGIDAAARAPGMLIVTEHPDHWDVRQILDDPDGHHDWGIVAEVDLRASDDEGHAVVRITDVGPV